MSNVKYGEATWDEEVKTGKPNGGAKDRAVFARLDSGSNVMRLVTKPYQYYSHKYKEAGDTGFGDKVMCSMPLHKSCPLCAIKDTPKRRWLVGVLNKKTSRYEVLDISAQVYKHIQELNRDEEWGDPINYDIDIKVDKGAGATGYYTVIAKPPRPLSEADLSIVKSSVNEEDLVWRCTPPTPEKALERLNSFREKKGKPALVVPTAVASAATSTAPVDMSSDASDSPEFDFPAAD